MDALMTSLQQLPQWMHIAAGVLVAASMAAHVLVEDL